MDKSEKKQSFFDWWQKTRQEYAEVLLDPDFEGLPIPEDRYPDEEYDKKIAKMWSEE